MSQFIFGPPSSAVDDQKGVANGIASLNSTGKVPSSQLDNMTGATSSTDGASGLVPAPQSTDVEKFLRGDGTWQDGGKPMVVLTYGSSTWNDFINAYNNNIIVYTRVSGRMAFMAYVNNASNPSEVEFQYYRSLSAHSATAQTDEVYVYKLNKTSGWTTTTRKAGTALAAGTNMSLSYANDVVTLNSTLENKAAVSEGTDVSLVTTGEKYAWNNKANADDLDKKVDIEYEWMTKKWNGYEQFSGYNIWTDGTDIYYSNGNYNQYVLDKSTATWSAKTWTGLIYVYGQSVWTDGTDIYISDSTSQYVLDKATSAWSTKTWNGLTNFSRNNIWTDGTDIYYSYKTYQYVLDKSTSTWSTKTWTGLTSFSGGNIWTDGTDIYYSDNFNQYVLDKSTSTWSAKEWTGLISFGGSAIWTDGTDIYYSSDSRQYVLDKSTSTWSTKEWTGLTSFGGSNVWTDGTEYYYSQGSNLQYVLVKHSKFSDYIPVSDKGSVNGVATLDFDGKVPGDQIISSSYRLIPKTWTGLISFTRNYIWTDGTDIYYSYSSSQQYVLDKSTYTWSAKTWNGFTDFYGSSIWTDGTNIYYSNSSTHYVLDKSTSTWSTKTWIGLTNFSGDNIWTDGTDIYYSNSSNQYVLDKSTSTWSVKTWTGLTNLYGSYIWTDGTNIYYSSGTYFQYVLNKSTSTWSAKTWNGFKNFTGNNIWTDGTNIYISAGSTQYVLDKITSTWSAKTWIGLTNFYRSYIWTDGTDIYYSYNSDQYQFILPRNLAAIDSNGGLIDSEKSVADFVSKQDLSERDSLLEKVSNELNVKADISYEWIHKEWNGLTSFVGQYIWTDGTDIYYSYNSNQYVLDKSTSTWSVKTWNGLTNFRGEYIWTDGTNIYYSSSSDQYVLDKTTSTWSAKEWTGLTSFSGGNIWINGTSIYYSDNSTQYVLDKSTSTWSVKTWNGMTNFYGQYIWTDGTDIYYSYGSSQRVLDKSTSTWSAKTWSGLTNFYGDYIWTDGTDIYYSQGSNQRVLDKSTSAWSTKTWTRFMNLYGQYIWTDGSNYFYSSNAEQYVFVIHTSLSDYIPVSDKDSANGVATLDSEGKVSGDKIIRSPGFIQKMWTGLTNFRGDYIWTDGTDIYYSYASQQYALNKSTFTWSTKTWTGLTNFNGCYIWTDGTDIYYSSSSSQYVLDKSTSTWSTKTWSGLTNFNGNRIWTDGTVIYYSDGPTHYVLDKSTSTWSVKTWNGLTNFYGDLIWTDGTDIYHSQVTNHYVLDKSTYTWSAKTWSGLTNFNGDCVWTDGTNIYYSSDSNQYALDKSTSIWSVKTWNGLTNFRGDYIWTDGTDYYFSNWYNQYQFIIPKNFAAIDNNGYVFDSGKSLADLISLSDLPEAGENQSGILTTGNQIISGHKFFKQLDSLGNSAAGLSLRVREYEGVQGTIAPTIGGFSAFSQSSGKTKLYFNGYGRDTSTNKIINNISEKYELPEIDANRTASATYKILTTKDSLDSTEKQEARTVIGAASSSDVSAISDKLTYNTITDFNMFKPTTTPTVSRLYGVCIGDSASNAPVSNDNVTYRGYVEGVTTYFTQHFTIEYATTASNRGRTFIRTCLGNTFGNWIELATKNDVSNLCYPNAGAHNAIYRGKYLGSSVTDAQWAAIGSGTFDDLFVGDYWTINGVNWRIAGFNYWYNTGNPTSKRCTKNHAVIVPDGNITSCAMNSTDITTGAYVGSDFYTGNNSNTGKAIAISAANDAFGSEHILSYRAQLSSRTYNGAPADYDWYDSTVELMNEQMVYGSRVWGTEVRNAYNVGNDKSQLPLFRHDHSRICNRSDWWLRSVAGEPYFAHVSLYGNARAAAASNIFGVRPVFGICQSQT